MDIIIREAKKDEWENVPSIYKRDGHLVHIEKIQSDAQKEFEEINNKRIILFAEINNQVEGLVHLIFNHEDEELADSKNVAYIHHFRVSLINQGKGIGSQLMNSLETEARRRGFEHLTLKVERGNQKAYKIYKHWGFRFLKDVKNEEEVVLTKRL